ncbi:MAG: GCN5-related N-acetyltransferase [Rhodospirillales bacterium]|nr:GCN5-related N-acetyltransferase [Rhodospirillales bacterium]
MTVDKLIIRAFEEKDRGSLTNLWKRCSLTVPYNNPDRDIDFAKGRENSEILIGLAADTVVASVMAGHDGHRGWIYYVAVDPDYQGRRWGRRIVEAGEEWLRARGVPKAQLMIRETNTQVRSFYEAMGWEAIPRTVMQKWLK